MTWALAVAVGFVVAFVGVAVWAARLAAKKRRDP